MRRVDKDTVVLFRRGTGCCPVVTNTKDGYTITDDYNGKVQITADEAKMLIEHLQSQESPSTD